MIRATFTALALAICTATTAMAQTPPTEEAMEQTRFDARAADILSVIAGEKAVEDVFAPAFLEQISAEQLAALGQQLTTQFGAGLGVESVEVTNAATATITLRFEKALVAGPMSLEAVAPHKVVGLLLNDIRQIDDGADKISADIDALPGRTAAWFGPLDGEPVFEHGDTAQQYALGSTFKLYVLAAAARAVDEGRLAWDDVLTLDEKSFPSGIMQNWPDDAPVTLHTAATLMISISDNTATDLVISAVGREAVEAEMRAAGHSDPEKSFPFLKTREMFILKAGDQGQAYAEADEAGRRAILAELEMGDLTEERMIQVFTSGTPILIDEIEWYASMQDTAGLMRVLAALPGNTARDIMAVNTALSDREKDGWAYVGYKGGSEAGVRNLSWLLQDEAGRWHMLSIAQMNAEAEIDTTALLMIAKRILALTE